MTLWIESPFAAALYAALWHFLWQGALIALAFAWVSRRLARVTTRYAAGVAALALMLTSTVVTTVVVLEPRPAAVRAPLISAAAPSSDVEANQFVAPDAGVWSASPLEAGLAEAGSVNPVASRLSTAARPVLLGAWFLGVVLLSIRLAGGWHLARRLARRSRKPAAPEVEVLVRRLAGRLALDRVVRVFESTAVAVPVMVGWLRPVVLLPVATLSGLSMVQVEALLVHELAHVRRHDYLINLLQSVIETVLFYHPAVWWVSRQVRADREHCCDDIVVTFCDRLTYVTALTDLSVMARTPRAALAATDGSLLGRVERLLGAPAVVRRAGPARLAALITLTWVGAIGAGAMATSSALEPSQSPAPPAAAAAAAAPDQTPAPVLEPGFIPRTPAPTPSPLPTPSRSPTMPDGVQAGQVTVRTQIVMPTPSFQERERQLVRQQREIEARAARIEHEKTQREMELEMERADKEWRLTLERLQADMMSVERALETERARVAVGIATPSQVADLEARRAELRQRVEAVNADLELQARQRELRNATAARQAELREQSRQFESAIEALQAERDAAGRTERAPDVRDPSRQIAAGDVVAITIRGEPDLPPMYRVDTDGNIRLPFVGRVRVAGKTPAEAQQQLRTLLVERRLMTDPSVEVRLADVSRVR